MRNLARGCAVWLFCLATSMFATVPSLAAPPNVLMICVDDLKPTLGCYGDSYAVTPNIDALAARGVRFDAAYCNQAVCAPSRNSLMTGMRPQSIGIYDLGTHFRRASPDLVTMTQHFMQHGFRAVGLGKIYHTGHGNTDDVHSWSEKSWRPKASQYVHPDSLANKKRDSKGRLRGPATEAGDVTDDTYADGQIALEATRRLERLANDPSQPFFLAVGFVKPHLPFVAPKQYWDLYDPDDVPMPSTTMPPTNAPGYAPTSGGELVSYSDIDSIEGLSEVQIRRLIHGYYAATSYMDAQLGLVMDTLDRLGLDENTIVVLWGDHGWHLGDHGMWCKHTNYEQATRIPLIVAAPNSASGLKTDAMVESVDVYPTLSALAGLPAPDGLDGASFAATVRDPNKPARSFVTHVYPRSGRLGRAIRDERFRMVQWKPTKSMTQETEIELYDYRNDPLETRNIADQEPKTVQRLLSQLHEQPAAKRQWKPGAKQ